MGNLRAHTRNVWRGSDTQSNRRRDQQRMVEAGASIAAKERRTLMVQLSAEPNANINTIKIKNLHVIEKEHQARMAKSEARDDYYNSQGYYPGRRAMKKFNARVAK